MNLDMFLEVLDEHLDGRADENSEVTIRQIRKALGHTNVARDPVAFAERYGIQLTRVLETKDGTVAFANRRHVITLFGDRAFESALSRSNAQRTRYALETKRRERAARVQAPTPAPKPLPVQWVEEAGRSLVATQRFEALQAALKAQEAELVTVSAKLDFLVAKVSALCKTWDVPVNREDKIF